ncbi:MAG: ribosome biogenesis GTPase Der [Candidatus Glassbacteria bacterium]|nr:ribosome biogenesis GTPase Der [Candidatus Glassbacteria bacterium]
MRPLPIVAVVGRPNVGKSTLFNRLVGRRVAITDSIPGVTRDRLYATVDWNRRTFELVDTAGLLSRVMERFEGEIAAQVDAAIAQADLLLFVVDSRDGPTAEDEELVRRLRVTGKPVVLAVNKIDSKVIVPPEEFHRWGLEHLCKVSALRGTGTGDLLDVVIGCLGDYQARSPEIADDAVRVAVIGKPNVGKSSLVNRLIGKDRMLVSDQPGTTRDPVDTVIRFRSRTIVLIDTAGLRKRMKTSPGVEYYTLLRTVHSIENCDVAVLLLDSRQKVSRQDLRIADLVELNGKSLILVMNKWDLVEEKQSKTSAALEKKLKGDNPHLAHVPVLFMSAATGQRVHKLLELVEAVGRGRRELVPTAGLNRVLQEAVARNQPPTASGKHIRLYYCTQVQGAPPTFLIFSNYPEKIPETYRRYLSRCFREKFSFPGTPIRLVFRKRESNSGRIPSGKPRGSH